MKNNSVIQPTVVPVNLGIIPESKRVKFHNDIPLFLIEAGTEDISRIEFTFNAGSIKENIPLLASSTNMMLTEGSVNYTAAKLNKALDFYGSFFNLYAEKDRSGIVIYCMNKHLEKVLSLANELLFNPVFPDSGVKTLMKKRLNWYLVNKEKVHSIAMDQFFESLFGSNHSYGKKVLDEDFRNINPEALKSFHSSHYTPQNLAVIIAGKIPDHITSILEKHISNNRSSGVRIIEPDRLPESQERRKVYLEKHGAVQTAISIGSATINKRHPDYPGLKILNVILGGYFGSRLMKNIREDKGYTYGIHSSVHSLELCGYQVISTEVSKKHTQNAIDEIYKEISLLQRVPVEKEEMEIIRNYMLGEMVRMFDGPFAIAESFRSAWEFGLDNSYYYNLENKIKSIEPDEITSLAKTYYNIETLYEITAG